MDQAIRILGIDPGLRRTGWGLVDVSGNRLKHVASGVLTPATDIELAERLNGIFVGLLDIIDRFQPSEAAVEETFVSPGARSALHLGQARGIAVLAPAHRGLMVGEYAANLVKKSVVGTGHADKTQIKLMVSTLLPSSDFRSADEADALAIAICHSHHRTHRALEAKRA